jgi:basic amino acid/polyamine antiporter, APA family
LRGLGLRGLATSQAPAADLMARAFGESAGVLLAIAVAAATITSINGTIIVGARTTYAGACDFAAFKPLGVWDQQRGIPRNAILLQSSIAMVLVVMGAIYDGFATLVDYTAPVYWLFLMGSGVAVIVLRQKHPEVSRPFKVPFYPILPVVFTLSSFAMLVASINYVKAGAIFGLVVLGLGLLVLVAVRPKAEA